MLSNLPHVTQPARSGRARMRPKQFGLYFIALLRGLIETVCVKLTGSAWHVVNVQLRYLSPLLSLS